MGFRKIPLKKKLSGDWNLFMFRISTFLFVYQILASHSKNGI